MSTHPLHPDIYALKPVREVEPKWWKLRWRPLWGKTFRAHTALGTSLGVMLDYRRNESTGWGYSNSRADVRIGLWFVAFEAWIRWNYVAHQDGTFDGNTRVPLNIPRTPTQESAA